MEPTRRMTIAHDEIAATVLDGEAIIINLTTGLYYSLDGSGALVWALIARGATIDELSEELGAAYGLTAAQVRPDVEALLGDLSAEGLVAERETAPGAAPDPAEMPAATSPYEAPRLARYSDMARFFALDPPLPELDDGAPGPSQ